MNEARRFNSPLENRLRKAGWYPGRDVWEQLSFSKYKSMTSAARDVLVEFGDIELYFKRGRLDVVQISFGTNLDEELIVAVNGLLTTKVFEEIPENLRERECKKIIQEHTLTESTRLELNLGEACTVVGTVFDDEFDGVRLVVVSESGTTYLVEGLEMRLSLNVFRAAHTFDDFLNLTTDRMVKEDQCRYAGKD